MNIFDLDRATDAAAAFDDSFDAFIESTACYEIQCGKSRLAIAANRGLNKRGCYSFYSETSEPCVDATSPCDIAQNTRLSHLQRNFASVDNLCTDAFHDGFDAADKMLNRSRIAKRHIKPVVADSPGFRRVRNLCDYVTGRVIVDGDLPLPAPTVDLSLVIRDLPDRQRSVAERLLAGDTAADIARDDGVNRSSVCRSMDKIRRTLLAADPTIAIGRS